MDERATMILQEGRPKDVASTVTDLEVALLIDGVARLSGFDFRDYAATALKRRIAERVRIENATSITGLLERLIHDPATLERFLYALTSMPGPFLRDPEQFARFTTHVVPRLRTYPYSRVWVAGHAADGYAVAVFLEEANLLERVRIYATEATDTGVAEAKRGLVTTEALASATERYRAAGGRYSLDRYLEGDPERPTYKRFLAKGIVFARHHLPSEGSFNEFEAVFVRAPLATYGKLLAYHVYETLYQSIARLGFLVLPGSESQASNPHRGAFEPVGGDRSVLRRVR